MRNVITTDRLILSPSEDERDLDNYIRHLKKEDIFYFQYGVPYSEELEEMIHFHGTGVIYYSVFLKDTDTMIGYVGVLPDQHEETSGELEFYFFPEYRAKGYAKEAVEAYLEAFFDGSLTGVRGETVIAETMYENERCREFLSRLGFQKDTVGVRFYEKAGVFVTDGVAVYRYGRVSIQKESA